MQTDPYPEGGIRLGDITVADDIYIVYGYTDMRCSIDGLCAIVQDLNLRIGDFDYDAGTVVLRHAQNDRSCIVPMCSSLTERLYSYRDYSRLARLLHQ